MSAQALDNDNDSDNENEAERQTAIGAILDAAPTLGLQQAISKFGRSLTAAERDTISSLTADEVKALGAINAKLGIVNAKPVNNNNNNNKKA